MVANEDQCLWHYTNLDALHKILDEETLRATSIKHMDDPSEFLYFMDIFEANLSPQQKKRLDTALKTIQLKDERCEFCRDPTIFVTCLTERGNDLSMWRSYCPQGGAAIGFDKKLLLGAIKNIPDLKSDYTKVNYFYDDAYNRSLELIKEREKEYELLASFIEASKNAPRFKNNCFSFENEWRCIYGIGACKNVKIEHRVNGMGLVVPFVSIHIENLRNLVREIEMSPNLPSSIQVANTRTIDQIVGRKVCRISESGSSDRI